MAFKMKGMEFGKGTGSSPNKFIGKAIKGIGKALGGKEGIAKIAGTILGGPAGGAIAGKLFGGNDGGGTKGGEQTTETTNDPNAVTEEQIAEAKQKMADNRKGGGTNATDAAWSEMMGESA